MGEGWSDWFGLMMTIKPGDTPGKIRGIGTYAQGQPTNGRGIRPAPYSTDFSVNNFTYAATNSTGISQPHGIGFVWSTMLWDMTWDLIAKYGYSEDLYNGKGGNNMAMQLVIDGLKLQPCSPGFVNGRDAILAADMLNYNGANQELIWRAFAKRGLGFSASQGLTNNRFDQVEAFDLPLVYACDAPVITAVPANNTFTGGVPTNLYLGYGPQSVTLATSGDPSFNYTWTGPAGLSSYTAASPVFTPTTAGVYTFEVTAVNENECTRYNSITITVVDVRCAEENEEKPTRGRGATNRPVVAKVLICKDGVAECAATTAIPRLLENGGASLGPCSGTTGVTAAYTPAASMESTSASLNVDPETAIRNYPNPFTGATTLSFTVKESTFTTLKVYDVTGRELATLFSGEANAGEVYNTEFKGENLSKGVYFYRLVNGSASKTGTMLMQR
jgi:extracellular elastinolytic metalloproteinase